MRIVRSHGRREERKKERAKIANGQNAEISPFFSLPDCTGKTNRPTVAQNGSNGPFEGR